MHNIASYIYRAPLCTVEACAPTSAHTYSLPPYTYIIYGDASLAIFIASEFAIYNPSLLKFSRNRIAALNSTRSPFLLQRLTHFHVPRVFFATIFSHDDHLYIIAVELSCINSFYILSIFPIYTRIYILIAKKILLIIIS